MTGTTRTIEIHVPHAAAVPRKAIAAVLHRHGVEGRLEVVRHPHVSTLRIPLVGVDDEAEGQLRSDVAGVIEQNAAGRHAELERRVAELEEIVRRAGLA